MNTKTKNILIISGSLLVVVSVGYYLYQQSKKATISGEDDVLSGSETNASTGTGNSTQNTPPIKGKPNPTILKVPKELDTPQKVQGFQAWMDSKGKPWINVNGKYHFLKEGTPNVKGKGLGVFGPATSKVWNIFGKDYLAEKAKWNATR